MSSNNSSAATTSANDLNRPLLQGEEAPGDKGVPNVVIPSDDMAPTLDAVAIQQAEEKRKTRMLIICFFSMVFFSLGNSITQVLMINAMQNYAFYVNLLTTFVYIPASFAYIWPMLKWGTHITEDQTKIPKRVFLYMGALDSIAGLLQIVAAAYIKNGTIMILVAQSAIPISMLLSRWLLHTQYRKSQYIACLIVAAGLALVIVPRFYVKKDDDDDGDKSESTSVTKMLFSILAYALANVPVCLSAIVKERTLGEANIDPIYLNGWVAVFQFLISFPLMFPVAAITNDPKIADIWDNIYNGMKCGVGINTVTKKPNATFLETLSYGVWQAFPWLAQALGLETSADGITPKSSFLGEVLGSDPKLDNCHYAPYYIAFYCIFNLAYNILIILVIKFSSANLLWLARTITVPLGSIAFSFRFMPEHKPLSGFDIGGLIVLMSGLIGYRFWPEIRSRLFGRNFDDIERERLAAEELANRQGNVNTISPTIIASSSTASLLNESAPAALSSDDFPPARGPSSVLDAAAEDVYDEPAQSAQSKGKGKGKKSRK